MTNESRVRHLEALIQDYERELRRIQQVLGTLRNALAMEQGASSESSSQRRTVHPSPTYQSEYKTYMSKVNVEDLKGMTVADAAKHIARANGGLLLMTPARRLMEQAGIIQDSNYARNLVHRTVAVESGAFVKAEGEGKGRYHLIEDDTNSGDDDDGGQRASSDVSHPKGEDRTGRPLPVPPSERMPLDPGSSEPGSRHRDIPPAR